MAKYKALADAEDAASLAELGIALDEEESEDADDAEDAGVGANRGGAL